MLIFTTQLHLHSAGSIGIACQAIFRQSTPPFFYRYLSGTGLIPAGKQRVKKSLILFQLALQPCNLHLGIDASPS